MASLPGRRSPAPRAEPRVERRPSTAQAKVDGLHQRVQAERCLRRPAMAMVHKRDGESAMYVKTGEPCPATLVSSCRCSQPANKHVGQASQCHDVRRVGGVVCPAARKAWEPKIARRRSYETKRAAPATAVNRESLVGSPDASWRRDRLPRPARRLDRSRAPG
ncbi:hypothetical protein BKA81DRAFT_230002 [Phyllosticta paracitricarpa]